MKLSKTEVLAAQTLGAMQSQLQKAQEEFVRELEERLGLAPGSVGTTHTVDIPKGEVLAN